MKTTHASLTHDWNLTPNEAIQIQKDLAARVRLEPLPAPLRLIAGADVSILKAQNQLIAGIILWDLQEKRVVGQTTVRAAAKFPYVPGLLSFREAPAVLEAFAQLKHKPDVAMFDGQGIAHPRRLGLASHLGILLDIPSIGCAKSRLIGEFVEPAPERGSWTDLTDKGELIGAVVRTRTNVKPLYISPGHRSDLPSAIQLVRQCATRYRLPEPTRLAHQLVTAEKTRPR